MSHDKGATATEAAGGRDGVLQGDHDHIHVDHIHAKMFGDSLKKNEPCHFIAQGGQNVNNVKFAESIFNWQTIVF